MRKTRSTAAILTAVFMLFVWCLVPTPSQAAPTRPNIVIIIADDLGYGDITSYRGPIRTPEIDKIAAGGIRFTDYHANPVCTPTRFSFFSGIYPQHVPGLTNALSATSTGGMPAWVVTLPEVLQKAGYRTGLVGKWHLGRQAQFHPLNHGFHFFYGGLEGEIDHRSHRDKLGILDWYENKRLLTEVGNSEYSGTAVAREAIEFINRNRSAANPQPFFLVVTDYEPHVPYQGPNDPVGYNDPVRYPAMVQSVDKGVGQIITRLRELGIEKTTLVVFMSDNGGHKPGSSNLPLRGGKGGVNEGGIRVPAIAYWPGTIAPRVSGEIIAVQDWYKTIIALTGAAVPTQYPIDSSNVVAALLGTGPAPYRPLFWEYQGNFAVRKGPWKLTKINGVWSLYNLTTDIGEQHDLAATNPAKLNELKADLDRWYAAVHK